MERGTIAVRQWINPLLRAGCGRSLLIVAPIYTTPATHPATKINPSISPAALTGEAKNLQMISTTSGQFTCPAPPPPLSLFAGEMQTTTHSKISATGPHNETAPFLYFPPRNLGNKCVRPLNDDTMSSVGLLTIYLPSQKSTEFDHHGRLTLGAVNVQA